MTKVIYKGTSDFQEFSKSDFEKAGVEDQGKVRFARGEPKEVTEGAAKALTSTDADESIFHDFSFDLAEDDEEARGGSDEDDEDEDPEVPKSVKNPGSRADQTDTDTTTGGTTGGGTARGRATKKAAAGNRASTRST